MEARHAHPSSSLDLYAPTAPPSSCHSSSVLRGPTLSLPHMAPWDGLKLSPLLRLLHEIPLGELQEHLVFLAPPSPFAQLFLRGKRWSWAGQSSFSTCNLRSPRRLVLKAWLKVVHVRVTDSDVAATAFSVSILPEAKIFSAGGGRRAPVPVDYLPTRDQHLMPVPEHSREAEVNAAGMIGLQGWGVCDPSFIITVDVVGAVQD